MHKGKKNMIHLHVYAFEICFIDSYYFILYSDNSEINNKTMMKFVASYYLLLHDLFIGQQFELCWLCYMLLKAWRSYPSVICSNPTTCQRVSVSGQYKTGLLLGMQRIYGMYDTFHGMGTQL